MPVKMPFILLSVRSQAFWTDLPTLTTVGSQLNKAIQRFHDCIPKENTTSKRYGWHNSFISDITSRKHIRIRINMRCFFCSRINMTGDERCGTCDGCLPPKSIINVVRVGAFPRRISNGMVIPATTSMNQYLLLLWLEEGDVLDSHCNILHFDGHGVKFVGIISDDGKVVVSAKATGAEVVTVQLVP